VAEKFRSKISASFRPLLASGTPASSSQDSASFFAQWFGVALIAVGIGMNLISIISDFSHPHFFLTGLIEAEFEFSGGLIALFGLILELYNNHL